MVRFFVLTVFSLLACKGWGMNVVTSDSLMKADTVGNLQVLEDPIPQSFLD